MSLSPTIAECLEGQAFSHTVTVTTEYVFQILSVTPSFPNNQFSNVSVTIAATSFTVAGTYNDVFDRQMRYVNTNKERVTVSRWAEIPSNFGALYKYRPPSTESIDQVYTVVYKIRTPYEIPGELNLDGTPGTPTINYVESTLTEQFTLVIRYVWQNDTIMVKNLIKAGNYYKDAKLLGKVDE
jgi:hypothetical protein